MSTRANIFIRNDYDDNEKEVVYHHYDGFPEGVGRILTNILRKFSKDTDTKASKQELAHYICESDNDFIITTPCVAADAEYNYKINLALQRVIWENLNSGEQEWLCDF